jgi:hypothetical protein
MAGRVHHQFPAVALSMNANTERDSNLDWKLERRKRGDGNAKDFRGDVNKSRKSIRSWM